MTTEQRVTCESHRCTKVATREIGLTRTLSFCDDHQPIGHAWEYMGMCAQCEGPIGPQHWHTIDGAAACCKCRGCTEKQVIPKAPVRIDWAVYRREGTIAADPVRKRPPKPPKPEPTAVEDQYVGTSAAGKTVHALLTKEPLAAVCGTRTISNSKLPIFHDLIPEGMGLCWKCTRDSK